MVNWKEIKELHVISKLEDIIEDWFGVEMFYTDTNYKIRSAMIEQGYEFESTFMKIQMQMPHGLDLLYQDIERVTDQLIDSSENVIKFESFFPGVIGIAAKIKIEGEFLGVVFGYPFVRENFSTEDAENLEVKLKECGANADDAKVAVANIRKMFPRERDYLMELIDLVSEEIATFHDEISRRDERINELNSELGNKFRYHSMIGKSKKMQTIYRLLEKISNSESTILIQGENGTGKELVAKAIHYNSPRKDAIFVAQNCSAFNDNLLDSELFGHVKGAFTGAVKDKKGLFEAANGGTLFLDEVGDTSLSMQVKLLRILQEGTFLPVGATTPKKVNVRVITATNKNLKEMIANGEFREDLYYRINVINVSLPSLRERQDDIPLLTEHFLEKRCAETGIPTKTISKKCYEKLLDYPWPGNVRELENEIERLVVLAGDDKVITPDLLSSRILEHGGDSSVSTNRGVNMQGSLKKALEELEIIMIREGLKRCNFNKSKLAKELGISRAGLIMKVEKYSLDKRKKAIGE